MKILFATNFTEACHNALDYIINLYRDREVIIDIIHVYDFPVSLYTSIPDNRVYELSLEKRQQVLHELQESQTKIPDSNRGSLHAAFGVYASSEIVQVAEVEAVDLIVMALKQDYNFFDRMLGSTTAHTIQKTDIPVLAIPTGATFNGLENILFPVEVDSLGNLLPNEIDSLTWLDRSFIPNHDPYINLIHIHKKNEESNLVKNKPELADRFVISTAANIQEGIYDYLSKENIHMIAILKPHRSVWERLYHSSLTRRLLYKVKLPMLVF